MCRPPCDEDVVKKGRRASAIAKLYITAKMREYYNKQDQRRKFGGARHSMLRTATVGEEAARAEGVDVEDKLPTADTGNWEWDDVHGWWWNPDAPPAAIADAQELAEGDGEEEPLSFEEFMARKYERERSARAVILDKKIRRRGGVILRDALHLAPSWVRYKTTEDGIGAVVPDWELGPDGQQLAPVYDETVTYYW